MPPQICDYSKTDYRKFWSDRDRRYEDFSERQILRDFLPEFSENILELGAGFGRLVGEYSGHSNEIILFDYALNLLQQVPARGRPPGQILSLVNGNIYELPFRDNSISTVVSVRVSHHLEDPAAVFREVFRVLIPGGIYIFEYANKKHFLEILRFWLGRTPISPFKKDPRQRGTDVYYNFHPAQIEADLRQAGYKIMKQASRSNFRLGILKKIFHYKILAFFDRLFSWPLTYVKFGPSIFLKAIKPK